MTEIPENIRIINTMSTDELRGWIKQYLETGDSYPANLYGYYGMPYEIIVGIVEDSLPSPFSILKEKIKDAIHSLLICPIPESETECTIFRDIVIMASRLKVNAKSILLDWANKGELRGLKGRNVDLHYCILESLNNIGITETDMYIILRRDFEDVRYTDVIFRTLCVRIPERSPEYFTQVVGILKNKDGADILIMSILRYLLSILGENLFIKDFAEVIVKLENQTEIDLILSGLQILYPNNIKDMYKSMTIYLKSKGYEFNIQRSPIDDNEIWVQIISFEIVAYSKDKILLNLVQESMEKSGVRTYNSQQTFDISGDGGNTLKPLIHVIKQVDENDKRNRETIPILR
jgi:hypothetical protein